MMMNLVFKIFLLFETTMLTRSNFVRIISLLYFVPFSFSFGRFLKLFRNSKNLLNNRYQKCYNLNKDAPDITFSEIKKNISYG
jgi:hypothetical protein